MKSIHKILAMVLVVALVLAFVPGFEIPVTYATEVSGDGSGAGSGENEGGDATGTPEGSDGEAFEIPEGIGTTEVPHLTEVPEGYTGIYTKADLDAVRNNLAGNYILMNDIEFTDADFAEGGDFYNGGEGWISIGTSGTNKAFTGTFDGNGYTIKNLYINCIKGSVYVGLFGYVTGAVKNLGMIDSNITTSSSGNAFEGGIIGYLSGGTVENCYNTGSVNANSTASSATYESYAGGIVGYLSSGTVKSCRNTGAATATGAKVYSNAGGIVGFATGGTVENCCNEGAVSAPAAWHSYAGGIVGCGDNLVVSNCYNTGNIDSGGYGHAGGVLGYLTGDTSSVDNCHNLGAVRSSENAGGIAGLTSGIVSNCSNKGSVSAIGTTSDIYAGGIVGLLSSSSGTVTNCYNTGSVTSSTSAGGIAGYTNYGSMSKSGNSGSVKSSSNSGGICGDGLEASVKECSNAGTVEGDLYCGGIFGCSRGSSKIQDSYNTGAIFSDSGVAGGIIASEISKTSYIQRCYNSGFVTGGSSIAGSESYISCTNVYYYAPETFFTKSNTKFGTAVRDFALVSFSGFDFENVWVRDTSEVPRLRWEENVTITELSVESTMSLSWKESRILTPDFGTVNPTHKELIWTSSDPAVASVTQFGEVCARSVGTARITVSTFSGDKAATCVVTVSSPDAVIEISTPEELGKIGYEYPLDGYYRLTTDLDLSTYTSANGLFYNDGNGWTPIGDENNPFTGVFDGCGYSVIGMNLYRPTENNIGLFGYADGAVIKNVNIKDATVRCDYDTGLLLGGGNNVIVDGCSTANSVLTVDFKTASSTKLYGAGGIAGFLTGEKSLVSNCKNYAEIKTENCGHGSTSSPVFFNNYGGIAGGVPSGLVKDCYNYGSINVQGYAINVGGVVGTAFSVISCGNYAPVSALHKNATYTSQEVYIGGVVSNTTHVIRSFNAGSIDGGYNTGSVQAGGISYNAEYVRECYNSAPVKGSSWAGSYEYALTNNASTTIVDCFNLAPGLPLSTSEKIYNTCDIPSSSAYIDGEKITFNKRQMQLQNTYSGWDFENVWTICENRYPTLRNVPFVFAQGVDFSEEEGILYVGETYMLESIFDPENATYQKVTYSSMNTAVATVSSTGVITPVAPGVVIIKGVADDGGAVAEYELTVRRHVSKVTLDKTTATIAVPNALQLTATVAEADAYDRSVVWTSSDDSIATVDSTGFVTAVKAGTATITVTTNDGGYTATCKVTVTQPVLGLEIAPEAVTLPVGKTQQITATVLPDDATVKTVTYASNATAIATVSSSGLITAKAPGTATITVTTKNGNLVKTCVVTVIRLATSVSIDVSSKTLTVNDTFKPVTTVYPTDTTDKAVTWSSSDETVASVAADGTVTAKKAGFANITVTTNDGGYTDSYTVTVVQPPLGISIPETATVIVGTPLKLNAVITPDDTTNKTVTWISSDATIARVDSNGTVTGLKNGVVTITAVTFDNAYNASCTVTVIKPATGVSLDRSSVILYTGEGYQLNATIAPADATDKRVTWKSNNPDVAVVDDNGKVSAKKSGSATITVTSVDGGYTYECVVTVRRHAESVTLDKDALTLNVGDVESLTATVLPEDTYNKNVLWASSDSNVATVSDAGVITALKSGVVQITVTTVDGNLVDRCTVTVLQPVVRVSLNKSSSILYVGQGDQLIGTVYPVDAANKLISWKSNNEDVATVDENGKVTAKAPGAAVITVTSEDGGYTAECTVTVRRHAESVTLDKDALTLNVGDVESLTATVLPEDTYNKNVFWASSDSNIAKVSNAGVVTALKSGTVQITVTTADGTLVDTCVVSVRQPVTGVSVNQLQMTLYSGSGAQLTATVAPYDAFNKTVLWTSSDDSVVSVDQTGRIQALKGGSAVITATTADGSYTATCAIAVRNRPVQIELDFAEITLRVGDTKTLSSLVTPVDSDYYLTWTSDTEAVASVDANGKISALRAGTAMVTVVTDSGLSAVCNVKVLDAFDFAAECTPDSKGNIHIGESWTCSDLDSAIGTTCSVSILDKNDQPLTDDTVVGTGCKIRLINERGEVATYTVIVDGDVNGDGTINAIDVSMFGQYLINNCSLSSAQRTACDMNGNGIVDSIDLFAMKKATLS